MSKKEGSKQDREKAERAVFFARCITMFASARRSVRASKLFATFLVLFAFQNARRFFQVLFLGTSKELVVSLLRGARDFFFMCFFRAGKILKKIGTKIGTN